MANYTKRIENIITKKDGKYSCLSKHVFVPHKGSKVFFRETTVNSRLCQVTIFGTRPAQRDLAELYEEAMTSYFKSLYGYKKLKRRINRRRTA